MTKEQKYIIGDKELQEIENYTNGTQMGGYQNVLTIIHNLDFAPKYYDDDYDFIANENARMAKKFEQLGYTQDQITDICNGAI